MRNRNIRIAILTLLAAMPALFLLLAQRSLRGYDGLQPGDLLPRARLQSMDRTWVETVTWRGTPTLLVVYQPGCKACRLELETLAAVAPSFPGVRIVLLSAKNELKGTLAPFPIYSDPGGSFLAKVRRLVTPTLYWIDASGLVRFTRVGHRNAGEEEELFRRLLQDRQ
jgi:peroxiredoxin